MVKILLNEIKEIFNWKKCLILFLISLCIYWIYIEFRINNFPNGRPETNGYKITVNMIEKYGQEMDEEEFKDFKKLYKEKIEEADKFLSHNADFNKFNIFSYDDYRHYEDHHYKDNNKEYTKIFWDNLKSNEGTIFWELQEIKSLIDRYEDKDNFDIKSLDGKDYKKRANEIIENKENTSILYEPVFVNYNEIINGFTVSILIGIFFMLTPIFLKDKKDKMEYIQYSSKVGRKLFEIKILAGLITSMIIATIELIICFLLYRANNTSIYFKSNINSCFNIECWYSMTFIQYIILTVICVYILSIITAFISMFISSKANSYIKGMGIQIPIMFIIIELTVNFMINNLGRIYESKILVPCLYLLLSIFSIALIVIGIRNEKKRELMD